MNRFPYNDWSVGSVIEARRVRFRGELESDAKFGRWQQEKVAFIKRDRQGDICEVTFEGYGVGFDPRHDWCGEGSFPCLMNEEYQLQFRTLP